MTVPADELIYSMAVRYARGGEEEKTLRGEDLRLLREIDPLAADQWESILAFYDAARESITAFFRTGWTGQTPSASSSWDIS